MDQCLLCLLQGMVVLPGVIMGCFPSSHLYLRQLLRFLPCPGFLQLLTFKNRGEDGSPLPVVVKDCDTGLNEEISMCLFVVLFYVVYPL